MLYRHIQMPELSVRFKWHYGGGDCDSRSHNKTPGLLDGRPTRGVGRTGTTFHNSLVVGSSPTSSTTQLRATGEIPALCRNARD
jgi:hypothetical protein